MAEFIEVTDYKDGEKGLINTAYITVIFRNGKDLTNIGLKNGSIYAAKESYEEIKAMLGVNNETKLA